MALSTLFTENTSSKFSNVTLESTLKSTSTCLCRFRTLKLASNRIEPISTRLAPPPTLMNRLVQNRHLPLLGSQPERNRAPKSSTCSFGPISTLATLLTAELTSSHIRMSNNVQVRFGSNSPCSLLPSIDPGSSFKSLSLAYAMVPSFFTKLYLPPVQL